MRQRGRTREGAIGRGKDTKNGIGRGEASGREQRRNRGDDRVQGGKEKGEGRGGENLAPISKSRRL